MTSVASPFSLLILIFSAMTENLKQLFERSSNSLLILAAERLFGAGGKRCVRAIVSREGKGDDA
jgi:hypothetical protein